MWSIEASYFEQGVKLVCGVDEAGAGPLAGPVCAGAVVLPPFCELKGLNDSKKLTPKKRDALYDEITKIAVAWAVGSVDEKTIDDINILNARFLAMRRAVEALGLKPDLILVDGNRTGGLPEPCAAVVGGDGKSASIAAASIIAKVTRDRYMLEMDKLYPEYAFARHKGYGTKLHYERIFAHGPSPIHRASFLKNLEEHR